MKNSLYASCCAIATGFACILPIFHSYADTIYVACALDGTIQQYATNGVGSVFARASLGNPQGEAFDPAGNLYVANQGYNTITKFSTNGVPSIFAVDPGDESILSLPEGLAFDKAGNLYVANDSDSTIEKFDTNGVPSVFATDDGSGTILSGPEGLAFDTASNLYVANDGGFISEFAPNGTFLGQFGDSSYLSSPVGVAFDKAGNLYVANSLPASDGPTIAKFNVSGTGSVFAGSGLDYPEFIAFDTASNLYVANSGDNSGIEKFDTGGNGSVFSQYGGTEYPIGLAFDHSGNLFEADNGQFIQEFDSNGYDTRFATVSIANPQGMGFDTAGNLYVANYGAGTIEKFNTNGTPSTFAFPYGEPYGLAVDSSNNIYLATAYNNQILKYAPDGSSSVFGTDDGSGLILNYPEGLAFDSLGNLYCINGISKFDRNANSSVFAGPDSFITHGPGLAVDAANNVYSLTNLTEIAEFSPAGIALPFATDPGDSYTYANVQGMAFDSAGNLYAANYYNGTVMKFDANGNGTVFASGLNAPTSVVIKRTSAVIAPPPTLSISLHGTNVVLSWSTAAANYSLLSATNIASANWLPVSGTPCTNGANLLLTNPISGPVRFFQLTNP